jgi:hypothetical protein
VVLRDESPRGVWLRRDQDTSGHKHKRDKSGSSRYNCLADDEFIEPPPSAQPFGSG